MQADPHTRRFLDQLAAAGVPPMSELGPEGAHEAMLAGRVNDVDPPRVARVEDAAVPGPGGDIPVRRYWPRDVQGAPGALLYFHGGGYVIGDLDTHDNICRRLCCDAGTVVVSVDYRLAPRHGFPAAVDDALAAFDWLCAGGASSLGADGLRLAVGGDSAGGTLAAVVARHARDRGVPLRAQLLLYPVTDLAGRYPSHDEHAATPPIPQPVQDWFWELYLGPGGAADPALRRDPRVSPLHAASVEGLAPAFVLTAGLDPLRDEGAAYAERLAGAGVETAYHCAMGTVHGFLRLGRLIPAAGDALAAAAAFLASRMAESAAAEDPPP
jgi:acetyl esterase